MNTSRQIPRKWIAFIFGLLGFVCAAQAQGAISINDLLSPHPATVSGQSSTLLPTGDWLLAGGLNSGGSASSSAVMIDSTGKLTVLASHLNQSRTGHSATLLPTGMVLILGGTDASGNVVTSAEQFNPTTNTFTSLGNLGLIPRTGHTATVLTTGQVLIAGGNDTRGHPLFDVELYNPLCASCAPELFSAKLDAARMNQIATLLPNANVLLWGGSNGTHVLNSGDVADPASQTLTAVSSATAQQLVQSLSSAGVPGINFSQPASEAQNVAVDQPLIVRFGQRMAVASLSSASVTLIGPNGAIAIKPVPVEYGVLLFVTPQQSLLPATRYTLFISGATDESGQALPFTAIGFTTAQLGGQSGSGGLTSIAAPSIGNSTPAATSTLAAAKTAAANNAALTAFELQKLAEADAKAYEPTWIPSEPHFHGNWRSSRDRSPLQQLAPLSAPVGETALAGQVLNMDGKALANVTLTIGTHTARSDRTGRFLITGLTAGSDTLSIDATSANHDGVQYGFYQVLTPIQAGQTNVLNYTIWMTQLNPNGNAMIASPTLQETVLTTPTIPGLELHIPAGTVIRGRDGKIVTQLNMTAIPIDRPPFPLPNLSGVPTYFTIQPGGSIVQSTNGKVAQGARLFYPNFTHQKPGAKLNFWNYDATSKGWYVYGLGTVSPDGKQVIPDPGVVIYEFTGAMLALPSDAPSPALTNGGPQSPDPVDLGTGLFVKHSTDLVVNDTMPIVIGRAYRNQDNVSRAFGMGANLSYNFFIVGTRFPYTYIDLILADGTAIHYPRISPGTSYVDAVYQNTTDQGIYNGSTIAPGHQGWDLTLKDGTIYEFGPSDLSTNSNLAAVRKIVDRYGNSLTMTRDPVNYNLTRIDSSGGRFVNFSYDTSNRVTALSDNMGRMVQYGYNPAGQLTSVTDPLGQVEKYTYGATADFYSDFSDYNAMMTVVNKRNITTIINKYDASERVKSQQFADGSTNTFTYAASPNAQDQNDRDVCIANWIAAAEQACAGYPNCYISPPYCPLENHKVNGTTMTDGNGNVRTVAFNNLGMPTSDTYAQGTSIQQTYTYQRDPTTNLVKAMIDPLGRQTAYTYDSLGNTLSVTKLAGTANAVTTSFTYNSFAQITSITNPLLHTVNLSYDSLGNLTQIQDANGNITKFTSTQIGQIASVTNALGNTTSLSYDVNDLVKIVDPMNNTVNITPDSVGRPIEVTDPLGNVSHTSYTTLDQVGQTVDALGNLTGIKYDASGNLTKVTDANNHTHVYTYDSRNNVEGYTDPLLQSEGYLYDGNLNLKQKTDRNNNVTKITYDALNRPGTITYADTSTATMTFDAGNRLKKIVDSLNGTIQYDYDGLNRVTTVTTASGTVGYTYYANGLRQTMTVSGQPTITYSYDNGNRLTQITQAPGATNNNIAQTVTYTYDAANRLTQKTLANGISENYAYDTANRLVDITYVQAGSVIGNLTYGYDAAGHRTAVGGSFARTTATAASSSGVDVNNRLTTLNGTTLKYDPNGNLLFDGTNTYTWNVRNQLVAISGAVTASFTYDAVGRRQSKTINGVTSKYVYDGWNIVGETNTGTTYLTGLGIDEVLAMQTGTGTGAQTDSYLTDVLGSTIRLTDMNGNKLVDYTYSMYGVTTADAIIANPFQYAGRENDGDGLYYYRARYYSPTQQRFISSDPIGLNGGINTYTYVGGNPINFKDPTGKIAWIPIVTVGGAVLGGIINGVSVYESGGNGWQVLGGVGLGALGGAAAGLAFSTGQGAFAGAAIAGWTSYLDQKYLSKDGCVDGGKVLGNMAVGFIGGGTGTGVANLFGSFGGLAVEGGAMYGATIGSLTAYAAYLSGL